MKRIGIITFFKNRNYGSVLQAYALSQYLVDNGFNAMIIDYLNNDNQYNVKLRKKTLINRLSTLIKAPSMWKNVIQGKISSRNSITLVNEKIAIMYDEFINDYLNPYKGEYHHEDDFDAFICGSDQIWPISVPGLSEVFFLRFTKKKKRIAYAVSLGSIVVPKYNKKRFTKYINEFEAISVRENKSVQLINECGYRDAIHVLDPTLLVGKKFWEKSISEKKVNNKYVLCYFLDACNSVENVLKLAKNSNLTVLWVETAVETPNAVQGISPTPLEFVSCIKNAEYVFTDSFHACCFSSIFEKSFYVVKRSYKGYPSQHVRIQELLEMLLLQDRHIDSCEQIEKLEPVKVERYEQANMRIAKLRRISETFLYNSLSNI